MCLLARFLFLKELCQRSRCKRTQLRTVIIIIITRRHRLFAAERKCDCRSVGLVGTSLGKWRPQAFASRSRGALDSVIRHFLLSSLSSVSLLLLCSGRTEAFPTTFRLRDARAHSSNTNPSTSCSLSRSKQCLSLQAKSSWAPPPCGNVSATRTRHASLCSGCSGGEAMAGVSPRHSYRRLIVYLSTHLHPFAFSCVSRRVMSRMWLQLRRRKR